MVLAKNDDSDRIAMRDGWIYNLRSCEIIASQDSTYNHILDSIWFGYKIGDNLTLIIQDVYALKNCNSGLQANSEYDTHRLKNT